MKYAPYVILFLVAVISAELVLLSIDTRGGGQDVRTKEHVAITINAGREAWTEYISALGGEEAYAAFKEMNGALDINTQHANAHMFGEALYAAVGMDGVSVCDTEFSYGCYHEYLGQAIYANGIDVVEPLNEACFEDLGAQGLSCQHGIGHGILSYFGYSEDDLMAALEVCRDLPYSDPIGGCYGGAFMEYNMRTMLRVDNIGSRELGSGDQIHKPCSMLDEEFLPACYYWQPQWWLSVMTEGSSASYTAMGDLCANLEDTYLRRKCFEGVGNTIPGESGYDPALSISFCEIAAQNETDELYCRSDAANIFFTTRFAQEKAPRMCDGLTGDAQEYCLKHSYNTFNQTNAPGIVE